MLRLQSIGIKLFLVGALIILLTAGTVALIGYRQAAEAITAEARKHILSVVQERRAWLESWLSEIALQARSIGRDQDLIGIVSAPDHLKIKREKILTYLSSLPTGRATNSAVIDFRGNVLGQLEYIASPDTLLQLPEVQEALTGRSAFSDIHLHPSGTPVFQVATPIFNQDSTVLAVLLQQFDTRTTIDPILTDTSSLGRSGETFLVNLDKVMLTPSRFMNHPAPLTHKMAIPPVRKGLEGGSGSMVYWGFLGEQVVGAYASMPEYGWILVAEMSTAEAFAGLHMIVVNTGLAVALALVLMFALALLLARRWAKPLENVAAASAQVASGDLNVQVTGETRGDEIGVLIRTFNRMVTGLRESELALQKSHDRLLQSEKLAAIGQLVSAIVHEMRSPLSGIKMNVRLLNREVSKDTPAEKHLSLAKRDVDRLETMLNELLDYSKPLKLNVASIDIDSLLQKAAQSVEQTAAGKSIEITVEADHISFSADEEQLLRLMTNLLSNAIEACTEGDQINLMAGVINDETLKLQIRDTGRGMPPRVRDHLFDPFFTTREDGTGLGMSNVKKIVEAHDGEIQIESEEGRGTTITILLPLNYNHGENTDHR